MISYARFGTLRLAQFLPDAEIEELSDWEYMDEYWIGEAVGFSEWLRLESEPETLRSLALDFADFPPDAAVAVLQTIDLPVRPGMQIPELQAALGEPVKELRFSANQTTYEFIVAGPPYEVSCTIRNDSGLSYLTVMRPLQR